MDEEMRGSRGFGESWSLPWVLDFVPSLFPEPPLTTFVFTLHFFCWKIKNTFYFFLAVEDMYKLGKKIFSWLLGLQVSLIQQDWGGTGRVGCMLNDFPSGSAYPNLLRPKCSTLLSSKGIVEGFLTPIGKAVWLQVRYRIQYIHVSSLIILYLQTSWSIVDGFLGGDLQ